MYRSILVPWESYLYLQKLGRKQRIPERPEHSEAHIKRMHNNFRYFNPSGKHHLTDGDMGGAENGRWVSWSIEQMEAILDEAGLPHERGQVEMIKL